MRSMPKWLNMNRVQISLGNIAGVHIWEHRVFEDTRGKLSKVYVTDSPELGGIPFVTFEHFFTFSKLNVFRGLHLQSGVHPSTKIVSLVSGNATDFLLDLRSESSSFGVLQIEEIDETHPKSIFVPTGVAHGYISNSNHTVFSYRYDVAFCQECDSGINPNVIQNYLGIEIESLITSNRDKDLTTDIEVALLAKPHP